MNHPSSMKTRHHRSQRKHNAHGSRRQRTMAARMPVRQVKQAPAKTPKARPREAPAARPPVESVSVHEGALGDGMNLVRSTMSDEEGTYLIVSIEVPAPYTAAYEAWTQFEEIPHFMRGGDLSHGHDGSRMTWCVRTVFDQFAWQAKICDQLPYEHIAWKSTEGTPHPGFGTVSFEPINEFRTWIIVQVAFDMSGVYRWLGDPLPSIGHSLEKCLKLFHRSMSVPTADVEEHQPEWLAQAAA
jgi:hypothetical protein